MLMMLSQAGSWASTCEGPPSCDVLDLVQGSQASGQGLIPEPWNSSRGMPQLALRTNSLLDPRVATQPQIMCWLQSKVG